MSSTAPRDDEPRIEDGRAAAAAGPGRTAPPVTRELIARAMGQLRELHEREHRPDEGLRERKKRMTRQLISDTATWMFCERGFDQVRVSEVAAEVGVSEKTVFNYFPTKESLVFDRDAELSEGIRDALTNRGPDVSPTQAMLAFIERECTHIDLLGEEMLPLFLAFVRLIDETPTLHAARQELSGKLVGVAREALAESVGVDPRDPEVHVAAQALITLWDIQMAARERHIENGIPIAELREAVLDDTRRAARLLDTGLWAFNSIAQGASDRTGLAEAAKAANEARKQVVEALRQARAAWAEVRRLSEEAGHEPDGCLAGSRDVRQQVRDHIVEADRRRRDHLRVAREMAEARGDDRRARRLADAEQRLAEVAEWRAGRAARPTRGGRGRG